MLLRELENGDVFHSAKDKKKEKFVVYGNCAFNRGYGSATRNCLQGKSIVGKSCRMEVVKTGVSIYAEKIKSMFDTPKKNINE